MQHLIRLCNQFYASNYHSQRVKKYIHFPHDWWLSDGPSQSCVTKGLHTHFLRQLSSDWPPLVNFSTSLLIARAFVDIIQIQGLKKNARNEVFELKPQLTSSVETLKMFNVDHFNGIYT